jgi:large subunit ribosomal protein L13
MKTTMKTTLPKANEVKREWILVDANEKVLGRLAVQIANVLRGRHKPIYTPHVDTGDFVVVTNAEKVKLTGAKNEKKIYQRYSGYRGGLKETKASVLRERHPERIIQLAVKGMMPKNTLCREAFKHEAQSPKLTELI